MLLGMAQVIRNSNVFLSLGQRGHLLEVRDEDTDHCNKTIYVPDGKVWELLFASINWVASADAGNRNIRYRIEDNLGQTIMEVPPANNQIAAATERYTVVGTDGPTELVAGVHILPVWSLHPVLPAAYAIRFFDNGAVQDGTQSQATLTIAEACTAGDTFTIGGVTFTIVAALSGAENEILLGANEAATKAALNAAFGASRTLPSSLHNVHPETIRELGITAADFAADDMVFTAVDAGAAQDAITLAETFAGATNVFDAATFGTTTGGVDSADTSDLHLMVMQYDVGGHGY